MFILKKLAPWAILVAMGVILVLVSSWETHLLSDKNKFLVDFLDSDLLSTLGFTVSVSLASSVSVHFKLNDLEIATGKKFPSTRKQLGRSATSLIVVFCVALVVVVVKPMFSCAEIYQAYFNSAAIMIMFFNISIMYDLLVTSFSIPPFEQKRA